MATYVSRTADRSMSALVSATTTVDGRVEFHAYGGGFVHQVSHGEFDAGFVEVSEAELTEMLGEFRRVQVDMDMDSFETPMSGWSNGDLWNGWAQPLFTKNDVLPAIEGEGPLSVTRSTGCGDGVYWSDRAGTFVVVMSNGTKDGGDVRLEFDGDALAERVLSGEEMYEVEIGGHVFSVELAHRTHIDVDGESVEVFSIGNGWCWEVVRAPEPDVVAAPRP